MLDTDQIRQCNKISPMRRLLLLYAVLTDPICAWLRYEADVFTQEPALVWTTLGS